MDQTHQQYVGNSLVMDMPGLVPNLQILRPLVPFIFFDRQEPAFIVSPACRDAAATPPPAFAGAAAAPSSIRGILLWSDRKRGTIRFDHRRDILPRTAFP